ncbi:MAG: YfjI family protein, partial [Pseudomonadota bacterium]
ALALQSVLAAASLATQALADVETLGGQAPVSLYCLSIATSGERKSGCDKLALAPVREAEQSRRRAHRSALAEHQDKADLHEHRRKAILRQSGDADEQKADLAALGPPPTPPLAPDLLFSDPTIEGLCRHFEHGQPSVGVFSDEGGQLFGGHAMNADNRLKTGAGLSQLWDGGTLRRTRASEAATSYAARRTSAHLMVQGRVGETLLADPVLRDQGLLSRMLVAYPESRIGYRQIPTEEPAVSQRSQALRQAAVALDAYGARIRGLLAREAETREGEPRELQPRLLRLSEGARALLVEFHNAVERDQRPDGPLAALTGFASKAAEQAARIAGVITLYTEAEAESVEEATMAEAVALMAWYLSEAQRLYDAPAVSEATANAETLRLWLIERWREPCIDVRSAVRRGPSALRAAPLVRSAFKTLETNHWLLPCPAGTTVAGKTVGQAWRINRP